jgi:hypothetical protein
MTNLITESTTNIVNELLDDIKENIIQINDNCMCEQNFKQLDFLFLF